MLFIVIWCYLLLDMTLALQKPKKRFRDFGVWNFKHAILWLFSLKNEFCLSAKITSKNATLSLIMLFWCYFSLEVICRSGKGPGCSGMSFQM